MASRDNSKVLYSGSMRIKSASLASPSRWSPCWIVIKNYHLYVYDCDFGVASSVKPLQSPMPPQFDSTKNNGNQPHHLLSLSLLTNKPKFSGPLPPSLTAPSDQHSHQQGQSSIHDTWGPKGQKINAENNQQGAQGQNAGGLSAATARPQRKLAERPRSAIITLSPNNSSGSITSSPPSHSSIRPPFHFAILTIPLHPNNLATNRMKESYSVISEMVLAEFQILSEKELVKVWNVLKKIEKAREKYLKSISSDPKERAASKIQAWWRMIQTRDNFDVTRQRIVVIQSLVRRFIARRRLRMLKSNQSDLDQRTSIAMEILETEASYVSNLDVLIRIFLKPLRSLFSTAHLRAEPVTTEDVDGKKKNDGEIISLICTHIEAIYAHHVPFLEELQRIMGNNKWEVSKTVIGDAIIKFSEGLDCYVPYCQNYEENQRILKKLEKIPLFQDFMESVKKLKITQKSDLNSFLILPVQRIPRYELLLTALIRRTPVAHPDIAHLQAALNKIKQAAKNVNRAKMWHDSKDKIDLLKGRLRKVGGNGTSDARNYIGEGPASYVSFTSSSSPTASSAATAMAGSSSQPLSVYLFLFTDQLLVCTPKHERKIGGNNKKSTSSGNVLGMEKGKSSTGFFRDTVKFEYHCNIPLSSCKLMSDSMQTATSSTTSSSSASSQEQPVVKRHKDLTFTLVQTSTSTLASSTSIHKFILDSMDAKTKWITDLTEVIDSLQRLQETQDHDIENLLGVASSDIDDATLNHPPTADGATVIKVKRAKLQKKGHTKSTEGLFAQQPQGKDRHERRPSANGQSNMLRASQETCEDDSFAGRHRVSSGSTQSKPSKSPSEMSFSRESRGSRSSSTETSNSSLHSSQTQVKKPSTSTLNSIADSASETSSSSTSTTVRRHSLESLLNQTDYTGANGYGGHGGKTSTVSSNNFAPLGEREQKVQGDSFADLPRPRIRTAEKEQAFVKRHGTVSSKSPIHSNPPSTTSSNDSPTKKVSILKGMFSGI
ncbi:hypothetical protein BKA69DRAFT_1041427 [Paraphysoderma sedebokerense]|nr:hypothetical protein BKA69DRAFT_1041427 [Paraphysoderma sedebokerense]